MASFEVSEETVSSYLSTLLWSETTMEELTIEGETYPEGTPLDQIPGLDVSDLDGLCPEVVEEARDDLALFASYCAGTLGFDPFRIFDSKQVAHDFALSRNGHGAGFFDDLYEIRASGPNATETLIQCSGDLHAAAKTFGTLGLSVWVNEDGELRCESHD